MKVIQVLGYSGSGKTTAITSLSKSLTKKGFKVGTLKHIYDHKFTIDQKAKDTHRYALSGSKTVVAVSPGELAIIQKRNTGSMKPREILRIFEETGTDYLLIEGFNKMFARSKRINRIICASTEKEALELLSLHPGPICISGRIASTSSRNRKMSGIPLISLPKDAPKVLALLDITKS
ncbi:MAG: molybdopterin-guanine dinucleotide biosynthesis protein B [Nitrososphaerota archaeon]|nr:molybdopterin-guanine dinucleotide biosynthesis protein B [Nitrososphaerota archaeon]